jgi:hypothetical protein
MENYLKWNSVTKVLAGTRTSKHEEPSNYMKVICLLEGFCLTPQNNRWQITGFEWEYFPNFFLSRQSQNLQIYVSEKPIQFHLQIC